EHLAFERGLSPLTRGNYARDIRLLLSLADKTPLNEVSSNHIRRFIGNVHARGIGGKSISRHLSAWRGFFDYLTQRHGFTSNPCVGMRAPKSPKTLPQALSTDQ